MITTNREAFLETVDLICTRPGMYVGSESLRDVAIYLDGFERGLTRLLGEEILTKSWSRWLEGHYVRSHRCERWTQVLSDFLGSDEAVLVQLPRLYREFFADLDAIGEAGIDARTSHRIIASRQEQRWE